jgi:hypothetical protein
LLLSFLFSLTLDTASFFGGRFLSGQPFLLFCRPPSLLDPAAVLRTEHPAILAAFPFELLSAALADVPGSAPMLASVA